MNHSGEAAEQVFKMTLDGAEVAIRLAGAGAKNLAVLLYTILSQQKKTKGRARLETMLRSGKELDVFNVKNSDMQMFVDKAKQYGILYCVMRDPKGSPDGITPVMVRVEDARRINDIVERFNFAAVNTATVRADIEKSRADKAPAAPEKVVPDRDATDKVVDELFEKPLQKEQAQPENPTVAKTEKSPPSEPILEKPRSSAEGTTKPPEKASYLRPSVREELRQIKAAKQQEAEAPKREEPHRESKAKQNKPAQHKQPQKRPRKQKKSKER
jgi:hypothetical protein